MVLKKPHDILFVGYADLLDKRLDDPAAVELYLAPDLYFAAADLPPLMRLPLWAYVDCKDCRIQVVSNSSLHVL